MAKANWSVAPDSDKIPPKIDPRPTTIPNAAIMLPNPLATVPTRTLAGIIKIIPVISDVISIITPESIFNFMMPNKRIPRLMKKTTIIIVSLIMASPSFQSILTMHFFTQKMFFQIINPFLLKIVNIVMCTLDRLK